MQKVVDHCRSHFWLVRPVLVFFLKGVIQPEGNFTHLLLTLMLMEALVTFDNPVNHIFSQNIHSSFPDTSQGYVSAHDYGTNG